MIKSAISVSSKKHEPSQINITYHDRPISQVQFNRDGDLLFSASKDARACIIRPEGKIAGIFRGHTGAIITMDVKNDTTRLVTGSADKNVHFWDVNTGKLIYRKTFDSIVRSVQHFKAGESSTFVCDDAFGSKPIAGILDPRCINEPLTILLKGSPTKSVCDFKDQTLIISDSEGSIQKIDLRNPHVPVVSAKIHTSKINNMKNSFCSSFFITSSSDAQAKIVSYDLAVIKTFVSEDPINSSAIFRNNEKVISGGGISARDVTLTRSKDFVVNFFDIISTKNLGNYSTHFGTINAVDIHPSCKMYASGGEEGIVCIVNIKSDFEKF